MYIGYERVIFKLSIALLNGVSSVEVTCFPNVLFRANLATDEIDAIVSATRRVAQYL